MEPLLISDSKKELARVTLRSVALNYIARLDPTPPRALLQGINNLKRSDVIVITKPYKGSCVVVTDKADYHASVRVSTKFTQCNIERAVTRGRHPSTIIPCWKMRMNYIPRYTTFYLNHLRDSFLKAQDLPTCMG